MAPMTDLANLAALEAAAALVRSVVPPTPQYRWPLLSRRVGAEIWVKLENHTPTGAFKVRGGVVYLADLRRSRPDITGVIAATTGNHGQSIAYSAAAHRPVLPGIVALGQDDRRSEAERGGGIGDALAVIAGRRRE